MTRGSKVFKPGDVPESNASSYPEPFRERQRKRYNRRLGDHAGLKNYGYRASLIGAPDPKLVPHMSPLINDTFPIRDLPAAKAEVEKRMGVNAAEW